MVDGVENLPFFSGLIGGEAEGWSAAIYISPRLKDALGQTARLHIDATFKVLPNQLNTYQLLTIHAEYMNILFPVVFAVMTRKTQQAYYGVFRYVQENIPEWKPQFILSDFKPAIRNAAQIAWPTANLVGCYFHYGQAVFRMHQTLWMGPFVSGNLEASMTLQMIMALALLPSNQINVGIQVIKHYVRQHGMHRQFRALLGYIDNFWVGVVGTNNFSVFGQSHQTNNALENFYRQLKRVMGERPAVWEFHRKLRLVEADQWLDFLRVLNNVRHVRPRCRAYVRQDATIHEASTRLQQGRYNVAEFLRRVAHCTENLLQTLRGERWHRPALGDAAAEGAGAGPRAADPVMPPHLVMPAQPPVLVQIAVEAQPTAAGQPAPPAAPAVPGPGAADEAVDAPAVGGRRRRGPQAARPRRQRRQGPAQQNIPNEEDVDDPDLPPIPGAPRPGPVRRCQRRTGLYNPPVHVILNQRPPPQVRPPPQDRPPPQFRPPPQMRLLPQVMPSLQVRPPPQVRIPPQVRPPPQVRIPPQVKGLEDAQYAFYKTPR